MFALPGIKLGWMAVSGLPERVERALRALELISDTFLPVNEIVQAAVPGIFQKGRSFLDGYRDEIRRRWNAAEEILRQCPHFRFVAPAGGFYVTLELDGFDEEGVVTGLLRDEHLLTHPGYFYDMRPHHLVFSFIQHPDVLAEVLPRLTRWMSKRT